MKNKRFRFLAGAAVVVGAIVYFAVAGFNESKAYYRTIEELHALGPGAAGKRLRVAGIVREGTIERSGTEVTFDLAQDEHSVRVHYAGTQPIPDTFKGGVEAVVEGELTGVTFEADHIQAKCASKYEANYDSAKRASNASM